MNYLKWNKFKDWFQIRVEYFPGIRRLDLDKRDWSLRDKITEVIKAAAWSIFGMTDRRSVQSDLLP